MRGCPAKSPHPAPANIKFHGGADESACPALNSQNATGPHGEFLASGDLGAELRRHEPGAWTDHGLRQGEGAERDTRDAGCADCRPSPPWRGAGRFAGEHEHSAPSVHERAAICYSAGCFVAVPPVPVGSTDSLISLLEQLAPLRRALMPSILDPLVPPPRLQARSTELRRYRGASFTSGARADLNKLGDLKMKKAALLAAAGLMLGSVAAIAQMQPRAPARADRCCKATVTWDRG